MEYEIIDYVQGIPVKRYESGIAEGYVSTGTSVSSQNIDALEREVAFYGSMPEADEEEKDIEKEVQNCLKFKIKTA